MRSHASILIRPPFNGEPRLCWGTSGLLLIGIATGLVSFAGCGTTKQATATDQMVASDAVDRSVSRIDFTPLTGQKVFLDTTYIQSPKTPTGIGFVNPEYVISSVRQQMVSAGLLIQETRDMSDFVVEVRLGVLGGDQHEMVYGVPSGSGIGTAASAVASGNGVPLLPSIPELSIAKRQDHVAAVKVAAFAYHRVTRERAWQSGISLGQSAAHDYWVFGAGPFQTGNIHNRIQLAGSPVQLPLVRPKQDPPGPVHAYRQSMIFEAAHPASPSETTIDQASAESPGPVK
ncbi:MAG: hypothetical protein DWH91_13170 [Planctomycetota bacterium]|nr:MAG: hypothetical protein DWH91_13170 [Planctomycetota bacterium]